MEWVLQVVDEIDDAISAMRLYSLGLIAEIGLLLAGSLGIASVCAALAVDAESALISTAAIFLSVAAAFKIYVSRFRSDQ
jgi:hypothetical protein